MSVEPEKETEAFPSLPGTQPTEIKGIVCTPGVLGGKPRIEGHRISVYDIAVHIRQGYTPEQIVSEDVYPQLTLEQVHAAMRYYEAHKEEIEERAAKAAEKLKQRAQEDTSPIAQRIRQYLQERREQEGGK